jgi:ATP-dependent Clp protease ATP-binding subunit ClpX
LFIAGGAFDGRKNHFETIEPSSSRVFDFKKMADNIDKDNLLQYIIPKGYQRFWIDS